MQNSLLVKILIGIIIIVLIYFIYLSFKNSKQQSTSTSYIKSDFDDRKYLVQDLDHKEDATYILSVIYHRIFVLRDYLQGHMNSYPKYRQYIQQFCNKINNVALKENSPSSKYTSYTVNKGQEIYLCLRSKNTGQLHDINLIMYVTIHELAHVACPEIDHTELFKKIFKFLLKISIILGIYENANYEDFPEEYCGLVIDEYLLKN